MVAQVASVLECTLASYDVYIRKSNFQNKRSFYSRYVAAVDLLKHKSLTELNNVFLQ